MSLDVTVMIHKPSLLYGFIIGAVIAMLIMLANRPLSFSEQLGCTDSVTIDIIKGHTITGCSEDMKGRKR